MLKLLPVAINTGIISIFIIAALLTVRGKVRVYYACFFLFFNAIDSILIILPKILNLNPDFLQWNWVGKIFSLIWALLFVYFGPFSPEEFGLTKKQRKNSLTPALVVSFIYFVIHAIGSILWFTTSKVTIESLIFQATIPGISEEIVYRGILLVLLIYSLGGRIDKKEFKWNRKTILAVILTSVLFGLVHMTDFDGGLKFYIYPFITTFTVGLLLVWLRLKTGSLLLPIIMHNVLNTTLFFISYLSRL